MNRFGKLILPALLAACPKPLDQSEHADAKPDSSVEVHSIRHDSHNQTTEVLNFATLQVVNEQKADLAAKQAGLESAKDYLEPWSQMGVQTSSIHTNAACIQRISRAENKYLLRMITEEEYKKLVEQKCD